MVEAAVSAVVVGATVVEEVAVAEVAVVEFVVESVVGLAGVVEESVGAPVESKLVEAAAVGERDL